MADIIDDPEQLSIAMDHESTDMDSQASFRKQMAARVVMRAGELGVAPSALADAAGIKRSSMTYYWRGDRTYPVEALALIAERLSTSVNWLLTGEANTAVGDVDLVGVQEVDLAYGLGGTYSDGPVEVEVHQFPRAWVESITSTPAASLFIARGRGDSMQPTINDGDMVLIDRSQRAIREWDAMWAMTIGDLAMIKRVRARGNTITILSDNDRVPSEDVTPEELNVVGRVIFIGRRV